MHEEIKTARLVLKPYHLADPVVVADALNDLDVSKWMSSVPFPYSVQDAEDFLSTLKSRLAFAIYDADGFVGAVTGDGDFGYWLRKSAWGQGYATEAGDAVIDAVFASGSSDHLYSCFANENTASGNVLRKLGFETGDQITMTSAAQNLEMPATAMTLTRERWQSRRQFRIETTDLVLRDLRSADWRDMQRIAGTPAVAAMLSSVTSPWSDDDAKRWTNYGAFKGRLGFFAAICLPDETVIGGIIFDGEPGGPMIVGYFIDPDHWGKGYATQATAAFLARFMPEFDLEFVEADHFDDNPASGTVLRKMGFKEIGKDMGTSRARVEAAPITLYRLDKDDLKAPA